MPMIGIRRIPIIPPEIPQSIIRIPIITSIRPKTFFSIINLTLPRTKIYLSTTNSSSFFDKNSLARSIKFLLLPHCQKMALEFQQIF